MPNWANCKLSAIGRREDLERFREHTYSLDQEAKAEDTATRAAIDCQKILPYPVGVDVGTTDEDNTTPRWYGWRIQNWGTKWNTCNRECGPIVPHPTIAGRCSLTCVFDTAWAAPIPVIRKLTADWPKLDFRFAYVEEGGWSKCAAVITTAERFVFGDLRDVDVTWVGDDDDDGTLQRIREFGYIPEEVSDDLGREGVQRREQSFASLESYGNVDQAYDLNGLVVPSAPVVKLEAMWSKRLEKTIEERQRGYETGDEPWELVAQSAIERDRYDGEPQEYGNSHPDCEEDHGPPGQHYEVRALWPDPVEPVEFGDYGLFDDEDFGDNYVDSESGGPYYAETLCPCRYNYEDVTDEMRAMRKLKLG